ncbi:MAG TPA: hypothetical protein VGB79_09525 [Allosphingosinicella sp.]|jgi:hypothetical protein
MFTLHSLKTDEDRRMVESLIAANPKPGLRLRPSDQTDLAIKTGQSYLVWQDDRLCACSLLYKFDCRPADGRIYSEIGTQLVLAENFGLQTFMAKLHLVQIDIEEEGVDLNTTFAVVGPGTASEHNLRQHVGLTDWTVPEALAHQRGSAGVPFDPAKRTLAASPAAVDRAKADFSSWHLDGRRFGTPKLSQEIVCDLPWLVPEALKMAT